MSFLPRDSLDSIITRENVKEYILTQTKLQDRWSDIVDYVCGDQEQTASEIFAILLLMQNPQLIGDFMKEGIRDTDLPLCVRESNKSHVTEHGLDRKVESSLVPIQSFDQWEYLQRFAFSSHQWWVKLPIFERSSSQSIHGHPAIQLNKLSILPWVEYRPIYQRNSNVVRVRIHDAHHKFGPQVSSVPSTGCKEMLTNLSSGQGEQGLCRQVSGK